MMEEAQMQALMQDLMHADQALKQDDQALMQDQHALNAFKNELLGSARAKTPRMPAPGITMGEHACDVDYRLPFLQVVI
jgi:hypothetical protein